MAITAISTDWGVYPRIVRVTTTDDLAVITTNGYLTAQNSNIELLQNGEFQWTPNDIVAISYLGGKGFFNVDYLVNDTFTPMVTTQQSVSLTVTTAQLEAMSATPVLVVPAAGAHTWIVGVTPIAFEYDYGGTQFTAGGAVGLEYGNTALLAGTAASTTEAAATINGFTANNGFTLNATATGTMASMVNEGIYLSNGTQAFATGNGSLTVNFRYNIYNTTA